MLRALTGEVVARGQDALVPAGRRCAVRIAAVERFLPDQVVTNRDLESTIDTTDTWIRERTGIEERRVLASGGTSELCVPVARGLLRRAGLTAEDIDLILVATITPDMVFPATACLVQSAIGASRAWGFDLSAACSGFLYALVTGAQFIASGSHRRVMVIGADRMSAIVDPQDRATAILFGDGAGGVLLEAGQGDSALLDYEHHVDGTGARDLCVPAGGSLRPTTSETVAARQHFVHQNGRAVFRFAVLRMAEVCRSLLARNGCTAADVKLFVPHQANQRIIAATAERLGLVPEQVVSNIDRYANTTAATIPIALSEAVDAGRLKAGDLVLLAAVGAGLTWGSALLRWGEDR